MLVKYIQLLIKVLQYMKVAYTIYQKVLVPLHDQMVAKFNMSSKVVWAGMILTALIVGLATALGFSL